EEYDHHAAAVRRAGKHAELTVPETREQPSKEFAERWVRPFYLTSLSGSFAKFRSAYVAVCSEIDDDLITQLLTYQNWRPRIVGGYFAAIESRVVHCDHIGRLLLRPDQSFADQGYTLALARFNTVESRLFLRKYLDHHLDQATRFRAQGVVMGAVAHMDRLNQTDVLSEYVDRWDRFVADQPHCDLARYLEEFDSHMDAIVQLADEVG
ncbi:MAG: DUF6000 family protein, partial [Planctomycetales bacterium]